MTGADPLVTDTEDLRDHLTPVPGMVALFDVTGRAVAWAVVIGDDEGGWTVARVVTDRTRAIDILDDLTDEPASRAFVRLAAVVVIEP